VISKKINLVIDKVNQSDFNEEDLQNAPDGFFEEIFVSDLLELSKNNAIIEDVIKKVRKNGIVKLNGVDGIDMCRKSYYGETPIEECSMYFGAVNRINSVISIKKYFEKIGWQINFAGINSGRYFVEAKRK
tara:strand:+ start:37892 stop:38284 length:393 start_codon:yes stop_codon:yes gene_type:complete